MLLTEHHENLNNGLSKNHMTIIMWSFSSAADILRHYGKYPLHFLFYFQHLFCQRVY